MLQSDVEIKPQVNQAGRAVLLAVALGIAADLLVARQGLTGAGFFVWMLCLIGATVFLSAAGNPNRTGARLPSVWSGLALMAAFLLVFRSTPVLIPMMLLVLLGCAVNWLLQKSGDRFSDITVLDYPFTGLRIPVMFVKGLLATAANVDPAVLPRHSIRGVIKGALFALPLLMMFALLFSSADARFNGYMSSLTQVLSFTAVEHLITMSILSVLALGLLAFTLYRPDTHRIQVPDMLSLGREETLVIMGSLSTLFLVFVVFQAEYLFGGKEVIEQISGLTLAEYARRGFFEMVIVAALTLVVLLAMSGLRSHQRFFQPLAVLMVGFVLIIMMSALQRLMLYVDEFGLSVARLVALGVMLWLAGTLVAFVLTVLRGRPQGFAFGAAVSATCLLLAIGLMNPAAIVAKTNIERVLTDTDRSIDVHYLMALGEDAVPVILAHLDDLSPQVQSQIASALTQRWPVSSQQTDWRRWNVSRAAAQRAMDRDHEKLESISRRMQTTN